MAESLDIENFQKQMQAAQNPEQSEQARKQKICIEIVSAIFGIIWGVLFQYYISDPVHYENNLEVCDNLVKTSQAIAIVMFISVGNIVIFLWVCKVGEQGEKCLQSVLGLTSFILLIIICVYMDKQCGHLYTLSLVFIILNFAGAGIGCCFAICAVALLGGAMGMEAQMKKEQTQQQAQKKYEVPNKVPNNDPVGIEKASVLEDKQNI